MAGETQTAKTLYDKLWDDHLVKQRDDGSALLYIDRHLLHEVTSPQAFEGLQLAGRKPWRLSANIATPDHNVPTSKKSVSRAWLGLKMILHVSRYKPWMITVRRSILLNLILTIFVKGSRTLLVLSKA